MGGLTIIIYKNDTNIHTEFIRSFMNIKHRGPDDTSFQVLSTDNLNNVNDIQRGLVNRTLSKDKLHKYQQYNFILGYHRLTINDTSFNASQPFEDPIITKVAQYPDLRLRPSRKLLCNGEIYNYDDLVTSNNFDDHDLCSTCDVEVILPLFIKYGLTETINMLDGEFSFCLTENISTFKLSALSCFAVRDYIGMRPLYYVSNHDSSVCIFVSEIKALPLYIVQNTSFSIQHVPPGTYWSFQNTIMDGSSTPFLKYHSLDKFKEVESCIYTSSSPDTLMTIHSKLHNLVTKSVISRYQSATSRVGVLLSGGFDSSLITSILVKHLVSEGHDFVRNPFHVFTVGDSLGSDDIDCVYASQLVNYLEIKYGIDIHHHVVNINNIEILASDIDKIVYQLETFEPETVNESIPFYYLLDYIKKNTDVKVLLTGDGVDELGSYREFDGLNDQTFQIKSIQLLKNMHKFDLLRLDKMSNMFGLEVRHPFLDKKFIEFMLSIHPSLRRSGTFSTEHAPIDKYIFRKTFSSIVCGDVLMEDSHLWREHRCLCRSLTNFELRLTNYINNHVMTDDSYNAALTLILNEVGVNLNTVPKDKLQMYFRMMYRKHYPNRDNLTEFFWDSIWTTTM